MENWLVDIELFITLIIGMLIGWLLNKYKPFKSKDALSTDCVDGGKNGN